MRVVRCLNCLLNQYETASKMCRRCHRPLYRAESLREAAKTANTPACDCGNHNDHIGFTLAFARKSANYTQEGLAAKLGCSVNVIARLESGSLNSGARKNIDVRKVHKSIGVNDQEWSRLLVDTLEDWMEASRL